MTVETDYLPNMDPLHGNLNIVSTPDGSMIETDADRAVAEDTSFRKISIEQSSITHKEILTQLSQQGVLGVTETSDGTGVTVSNSSSTIDIESSNDNENYSVSNSSDLQTENSVKEDDKVPESPTIDKINANISGNSEDESPTTTDNMETENYQKTSWQERKEVYMTSAGRISISLDCSEVNITAPLSDRKSSNFDPIQEESTEQVGRLIARADSLIGHVDAEILALPNSCDSCTDVFLPEVCVLIIVLAQDAHRTDSLLL